MTRAYLCLALAILTEIAATTFLPATQQFTRIGPSLAVVVGYAVSFYFLSAAVAFFPVGLVYAIWSGCGVVGIALLARFAYGQVLDAPALIGMAMIVGGVLVIHLFSRSVTE